MAEGVIFLIMLGVFAVTAFAFKFPVGVCMMLASIAGAISDGHGLALRHLVEGTFGYMPTMLVIVSAMVLMKFIQKSGLLETVARGIIDKFANMKALMLAGLTLLIMFPGMITGSSSACVLTTGTLVVPVLTYFGLPRQKAGAMIAMSAVFGMIAPPVNLPAMIIGAGIDMPYVGFFTPLLIATVPIAIISSLVIALPTLMKKKDAGRITDESLLPVSYYRQYGFKMLLPLIVLVVLMVLPNVFLGKFRDLGMPLVMAIAAAFATFTGKRFNAVQAAREAIVESVPVLSKLVGVGMFIQIMTLTGVRGFIVVSALSIPAAWLLVAMAVTIPAFGSVSAFGSASVLGVPFVLALSGSGNVVMLTIGVTLLVCLGDLVPPTALAGVLSAQVVKEPVYYRLLKHCMIPAVLTIAWGLLIISNSALFAKWLL